MLETYALNNAFSFYHIDIFLSLSTSEELQKEINELKEKLHENDLFYQHEIESLVEERDQAREKLQERDNNALASSNSIESQTTSDTNEYDYAVFWIKIHQLFKFLFIFEVLLTHD